MVIKQVRRSVCALSAAALAISLVGCGGSQGGTVQTKSSGATGSVGSTTTTAASGKTSKGSSGYASLPDSDVKYGEKNQQTYPLSTDGATLTMWYPIGDSMGTLPDPNDGEFWQWYEKKTGVHVNFIVPATGTEADSFQLLFASDDMPDIVYSQPSRYMYKDGEDASITDGYFEDISKDFDLCPNYVSWLRSDTKAGHAAFTDSGKMYGMWGIWKTLQGDALADQGIAIRKDFLDKVGMDVPTTYSEWEKVLTAFKDQLGIEAPFYTSKYGIDDGEFMAGYDTAPYWYQRNGKVCYGPMDDQYKDYLSLLHDWYEKGLLDQNFATRQSTGIKADDDMMLNDKVGALVDYGTRLSDTYVTRGATNKDFYLVGVQQPKKDGADAVDPAWRNYSSGSDNIHGMVANVNANSKNKELAIRWLDGLYAADVYLNANYGIESEEGTVWKKADDGDPNHRIGIYDFRYHNPNGDDSATVLVKYWSKNPPIRVEGAQIEQADENKQEGYKTWSKYPATNYLPTRLTMTVDEGTEYSGMYTDIETYVQEMNVKFIMGQESLNNYDAYREKLKSMGIEECQKLQQAALDRYNAR